MSHYTPAYDESGSFTYGCEVPVKARRRAGSSDTFERRYEPVMVEGAHGSYNREWDDPLVQAAPDRHIWTLVDCDGALYVVPGIATVNYIARIVTRNAWSDVEFSNPGYLW